MPCDLCANTGYIVVEVPVFADGGYSDVDRIERPCACNPEPTDADAPDWQDVPELWAQDYPGIDFDERMPPLRPDPSDYWLPAHLLA